MSKLVKIQATLEHPELQAGCTIRVMDADPVAADLLATTTTQGDGRVDVLFDLHDAGSVDTPLERAPDVYFEWVNGDTVLARSPVFPSVDFFSAHPVTGMRHDGTVNLGAVALTDVGAG